MKLDVAHRCRPCRGETRAGDAAFFRTSGDASLLAVIDALGHGPAAADTADRAVEFLRAVTLGDGVRFIMEGLHDTLHASRGAAATLCLLVPAGLEGSGVGNVGLRVFGSRVGIMLTPGILGRRLRGIRVFQGELGPRSRLVLFSDGVRLGFSEQETRHGSVLESCDAILKRYGREDDDATVLIAEHVHEVTQ